MCVQYAHAAEQCLRSKQASYICKSYQGWSTWLTYHLPKIICANHKYLMTLGLVFALLFTTISAADALKDILPMLQMHISATYFGIAGHPRQSDQLHYVCLLVLFSSCFHSRSRFADFLPPYFQTPGHLRQPHQLHYVGSGVCSLLSALQASQQYHVQQCLHHQQAQQWILGTYIQVRTSWGCMSTAVAAAAADSSSTA